MLDEFLVVQFHTQTDHRVIHIVHTNGKRQYQQVVSLDYFHRGRKALTEKRNRNKGYIFMARFQDEFESDCKWHDYSKTQRVHHASAWDYYKYIGFDYKNQVWI